MLNNIMIYLGIGVIFMVLIEWLYKRSKNYEEFINVERIIGIIGWPIFLIQYIVNLINILNGKR
tara:strand:- start:361 stop:552 length:192 start_codon:yes stop_codon:yes gene_type:complete